MMHHLVFFHWNCRDRIGGDIEEARSAAPAIVVVPAEKVLLRVASDLRRCSSLDEVPRDSSPIAFPNLLKSQQEKLVFFFRPWNSSLPLTLAVSAGVVNHVVLGGISRSTVVFAVSAAVRVSAVVAVVGGLLRLFVLREIVQTHALPHGIHHHSDTKQHDLSDAGIFSGGGNGGGGCGGRRMIVVRGARGRHLHPNDRRR